MTDSIELEISERFAFADGEAFAEAGPYEGLIGRARFAVDPAAPAQAESKTPRPAFLRSSPTNKSRPDSRA